MTKALLKSYQKFDCYYLYVFHTLKGKEKMSERIINKTLCFNSPKATIQKEKENENPYHEHPKGFLLFFSKKIFTHFCF